MLVTKCDKGGEGVDFCPK